MYTKTPPRFRKGTRVASASRLSERLGVIQFGWVASLILSCDIDAHFAEAFELPAFDESVVDGTDRQCCPEEPVLKSWLRGDHEEDADGSNLDEPQAAEHVPLLSVHLIFLWSVPLDEAVGHAANDTHTCSTDRNEELNTEELHEAGSDNVEGDRESVAHEGGHEAHVMCPRRHLCFCKWVVALECGGTDRADEETNEYRHDDGDDHCGGRLKVHDVCQVAGFTECATWHGGLSDYR